MVIDWFTISAQVLNFVILLWLLKHFLYGPILNALDTREEKIANDISDATNKKLMADNLSVELKKKLTDFNQDRSDLLKTAKKEVEDQKTSLLEEAKQEIVDKKKRWSQSLLNEQEILYKKVTSNIERELFLVVRKTLNDLAGLTLEECIADKFIEKFENLEKNEKEKFIAYLDKSRVPLLVLSSFDLSEELEQQFRDVVHKVLGREMKVQFQTSSRIVSGIEFVIEGYKYSWSVDHYISSMQEKLGNMLSTSFKNE